MRPTEQRQSGLSKLMRRSPELTVEQADAHKADLAFEGAKTLAGAAVQKQLEQVAKHSPQPISLAADMQELTMPGGFTADPKVGVLTKTKVAAKGLVEDKAIEAGMAGAKFFARGAINVNASRLAGAKEAATPYVEGAIDTVVSYVPPPAKAALGAAASFVSSVERPDDDTSLMSGTFPGSEDAVRAQLLPVHGPEPAPPTQSLSARIRQKVMNAGQKADEKLERSKDRAAEALYMKTESTALHAAGLVFKGGMQALARASEGLPEPDADRVPGSFPGSPVFDGLETEVASGANGETQAPANTSPPEQLSLDDMPPVHEMPGAFEQEP